MMIYEDAVSGRRDHCLRSSSKIKEITLLTGEDRKSGKTDRFRYPQALHTGRDGWQKVMVLVNLKPAKLAGVVSEGMLLCAEDENGELALMVPEKRCQAEQRSARKQKLRHN